MEYVLVILSISELTTEPQVYRFTPRLLNYMTDGGGATRAGDVSLTRGWGVKSLSSSLGVGWVVEFVCVLQTALCKRQLVIFPGTISTGKNGIRQNKFSN
jgi:hypothetical protein